MGFREEHIEACIVLYKWSNGHALENYRDHSFTTDGKYLFRNYDLVGIRTDTFSFVVKVPEPGGFFSWDGVPEEILEEFFERHPEYRTCFSFIDARVWNNTPRFKRLADENCEQIPF